MDTIITTTYASSSTGNLHVTKTAVDDDSAACRHLLENEINAIRRIGSANPHVAKFKRRYEYVVDADDAELIHLDALPVDVRKLQLVQILLCVGGWHESIDLIVNEINYWSVQCRRVAYEYVTYLFDDAFYAVETKGYVPVFVDLTQAVFPSGPYRPMSNYAAGFLPHVGHPMDDVKRVLILFSVLLGDSVDEFADAIKRHVSYDVYDVSERACCRQMSSWDLDSMTKMMYRISRYAYNTLLNDGRSSLPIALYATAIVEHLNDHIVDGCNDDRCFSFTSFKDPFKSICNGDDDLRAFLTRRLSRLAVMDFDALAVDDDCPFTSFLQPRLASMMEAKKEKFGEIDRRLAREFVERYMRAYYSPSINPEYSSCFQVDMRRRKTK